MSDYARWIPRAMCERPLCGHRKPVRATHAIDVTAALGESAFLAVCSRAAAEARKQGLETHPLDRAYRFEDDDDAR